MPLEKGGRADKLGNRYETKCIIYELLKVLREVNDSIVIEALGEDEAGTDILVTDCSGRKEHQQCKARNASKEYWSISDLKSRNILSNWKKQLEREGDREVALVSAVGCSYMVDLHDRTVNSNGNPNDFYQYQIETASREFQNFYKEFCKGMGLDISKPVDISRSIQLLKRIHFKQISEYVLRESIFQDIDHFFTSEKEKVYQAFVALVTDSEIYGQAITAAVLSQYFEKQRIKMRLIDGDRRILPRVQFVNKEYRNCFKPLKEGLIERSEFAECIKAINEGQSFVVSGNAGYGKSGCTEAVLDFCEKEDIPYIAIKLDRRIPRGSSDLWGKELGFSGSVVYALNALSRDRRGVLVLDQLDALRWTQANSSEALSVCMEMIRQVRHLNEERDKKMVIVFVCREYDLNNDSNIKSLFEEDVNRYQKEWKRIVIKDFDEVVVKKVVGQKYEQLTLKTRRLLQVPSNLYIWQHLEKGAIYDDCTTTSHLIEYWFRQICQNSSRVGVEEKVVQETVHGIVDVLDRIGRLYAPRKILSTDERGIDYLVSSELLVVEGQKVGFVHQSILDYFISNKMTNQFYQGDKIEAIIGDKSEQTPGKRYQVQMFLQNLLEYDSGDFLTAGRQMLESSGIRFYVRYVFYEILRQIMEPDEAIVQYVKQECQDETNCGYFVKNVVWGKQIYITILRKSGFFEQWYVDADKKNRVFLLLKSISPDLDDEEVAFIEKHSFEKEEDDRQFMGCFYHDIMEESDKMFELRMKFYDKYPVWSTECYIDIKAMMKHCETRTIQLIALWLKHKITSKGKTVYQYEEELVDESDSFFVHNFKFVMDQLIPYVPMKDNIEIRYSAWNGRHSYRRGIERTAMELLKKADAAMIATDPEAFWKYYFPYMGKNYDLYNELILDGFQFLPKIYSDRVIAYLSEDFEGRAFDWTSGAKDRLGLVKKGIEVHTLYCGEEVLDTFLDAVIKYVPSDSVEWYRRRIEFNREKEYRRVYWSYWGDFQYHILQSVAQNRLAKKYKNLYNVLDRKFQGKAERYIDGEGHSGWVHSPVSGKEIAAKQWLKIITNKKISEDNHCSWKEVKGGFIESSLSMFAEDFEMAVQKEPGEMLEMVMSNKKTVIPVYVDMLYAGVAYSEDKVFEKIEQNLLQQLFRKFPCDLNDQRKMHFCKIIGRFKKDQWSDQVTKKLKEIIIFDNEEDKTKKNAQEMDSEGVLCQVLNDLKGCAIRTVGDLLWENKEILPLFQKCIDRCSLEEDAVLRMASLYALCPIYNIDREWAEQRILHVYESDVRMARFPNSREMLFRLYLKYKKRVLKVALKWFEAKEKYLVKSGAYSICEFYIRDREFSDVITDMKNLSEEQVRYILDMAVIYLKYDEYRETSKNIILRYRNLDMNLEFPLANIFYDNLVDIERDSQFLILIMQSQVSRKVTFAFVRFLEENACCVKDYAEIIIALCENLIEVSLEELEKQWGIESEVSKLILALYDESANSSDESDKKVAEKCLELWDMMFEKQIGQVRELSRQLMER